jgi:Bax protein
MNKLLNFVCFPLLLVGLIFLSSGLVGYGTSYNKYIENNTHTANQINSLYSEKEIILKDPPVSEVLSEKLFVKIRVKPINPKITSKIKNLNELNNQSSLLNKDFDYLDSNKKDFVKTVLPIIINENQNILMTRSFVKNLKNKLETFRTLENKEIRTLNDIAKNYNIKYLKKHKLDLVNEILFNVDVIPNSIVLAQAAIESGWGSSRFAREHNALFGEYTYDTEKGVIPLNRDSGKTHLIKSFNSLDSSVKSYFNNINSHYAYREFRDIRKIMRDKNNFSDVNLLVEKLETYAADSNYVNTIRSVIEKNNFKLFDNKTISY